MFSMQDLQNMEHNGTHYKQTHICDKSGNIINFKRAIWIESAKLMECFDWKTGINKEDKDIKCSKSIALNIWGLLMSDLLLEGKSPYDYTLQIEKSIDHAYEDNEFSEIGIYTLIESFTALILNSKESLVTNFAYMLFFSICKRLDISFDELYNSYLLKGQNDETPINHTNSNSSINHNPSRYTR
jgi:hypothetical protein